jgi:hypothetical protein
MIKSQYQVLLYINSSRKENIWYIAGVIPLKINELEKVESDANESHIKSTVLISPTKEFVNDKTTTEKM